MNTIRPEDFASPEAIERNLQRLVRLGDGGRTGNLFALPVDQPVVAALDRLDLQACEVVRRAESKPAQPSAPQSVLSIFASGEDLPLFSS